MNISNAINTVSVSGSFSSSAKTSEKNKWQLTDSLKEKIVELAKKNAKNNIYMGNEFMNLRKAEVAKVAPNRAALIGKFNQSMSSGNMGDMKEIQEADKRWRKPAADFLQDHRSTVKTDDSADHNYFYQRYSAAVR